MNEKTDAATRRHVLAAATGASVGALLSGCGGSDTGSAPADTAPDAQQTTASGPKVLAKTSDIPVKGGKIFTAEGVVVTQPQSGKFKAFSAVCPHRGCALTAVDNGSITCKCHGARFNLTDGSVQGGPAEAPLDPKSISVENGTVTLI
jgi:nitrite reductase/ring-hydroxylating ferredoxin subunit